MAPLRTMPSSTHADDCPFEIEAEYCSTCGNSLPNEDYVLFERDVGMCVADGIGGAPLGDAVARYACHIAMSVLREGGTTYEAVRCAGKQVKRFVTAVDSPRSGASLVVARIDRDKLEASWAGNAAVFLLNRGEDETSLMTNLEHTQLKTTVPLCGTSQARVGRLSTMLEDGDTIVLCTDGTWRCVGNETIGKLMSEGTSPREIAARLVLGHQSDDDSTALVARVHKHTRAT